MIYWPREKGVLSVQEVSVSRDLASTKVESVLEPHRTLLPAGPLHAAGLPFSAVSATSPEGTHCTCSFTSKTLHKKHPFGHNLLSPHLPPAFLDCLLSSPFCPLSSMDLKDNSFSNAFAAPRESFASLPDPSSVYSLERHHPKCGAWT